MPTDILTNKGIQIKFESFNDGICTVWKVSNISEQGFTPKDGLTNGQTRRFQRKNIFGKPTETNENYAETQHQVISEIIKIPLLSEIDINDIVTFGSYTGKQFRIIKNEPIRNSRPPINILTLERIEKSYDIRAN